MKTRKHMTHRNITWQLVKLWLVTLIDNINLTFLWEWKFLSFKVLSKFFCLFSGFLRLGTLTPFSWFSRLSGSNSHPVIFLHVFFWRSARITFSNQFSIFIPAIKGVGGVKFYLSFFLHFYACYRAIFPGFKKCSFVSWLSPVQILWTFEGRPSELKLE